jgi:RNA polymerase sigma-70 factor (ECF subfamily)
MTGDFTQAEDLAQETFLKAFRNLAAFDTTRRLSSWLFRIAHNTALDALRRTRTRLVSIDEAVDRLQDPTRDNPEAGFPIRPLIAQPEPDPVERRALGEALEAALSELRPDHRIAVSLRYEEGLSFEEIGHVLGIPETTARSHVHRARKELSRRLAAGGWHPS